jgi:predicted metal-dependent phosphotriesterase family hydrolase
MTTVETVRGPVAVDALQTALMHGHVFVLGDEMHRNHPEPDDLGYVGKSIDQDSYVGMDRFGLDLYMPGEQRVTNLVRLVDEGLADRLMLSHDASCPIDSRGRP